MASPLVAGALLPALMLALLATNASYRHAAKPETPASSIVSVDLPERNPAFEAYPYPNLASCYDRHLANRMVCCAREPGRARFQTYPRTHLATAASCTFIRGGTAYFNNKSLCIVTQQTFSPFSEVWRRWNCKQVRLTLNGREYSLFQLVP